MPGRAGPTTPPWQRHQALTPRRFGLIPFRSPLLRDSRYCFLFLGLLRCFSSPGSLLRSYVFRPGYQRITAGGFPHSDILGSMVVWRLPEAFRSLPRPSSAPSAKASTVRPYQLGIDARARYGVSKVPEKKTESLLPGQKKPPARVRPAGWHGRRCDLAVYALPSRVSNDPLLSSPEQPGHSRGPGELSQTDGSRHRPPPIQTRKLCA